MAVDELRTTLSRHGIQAEELSVLVETVDGPIVMLPVAGTAAITLWRRLRGLVDETGRWSVILGPEDDNDGYERLLEPFDHAEELFGATPSRPTVTSFLIDETASRSPPRRRMCRTRARG